MNRTSKTLSLGNGYTRYITRLETEECEPGTPLFRHLQFEIFKQLASDPALTTTGPRDFETGKIFHDGNRWIFELQCDVRPV